MPALVQRRSETAFGSSFALEYGARAFTSMLPFVSVGTFLMVRGRSNCVDKVGLRRQVVLEKRLCSPAFLRHS